MQVTSSSSFKRLSLATLLIALCLVNLASSAPISATLAIENAANIFSKQEKAIVDVFRAADHFAQPANRWAIDSASKLTRSPSFLERLRNKLAPSPLKVTQLGSDGMVFHNTGTSPRMIRLGTADKAFLVMPGSKETFRGLRKEQISALTTKRLDSKKYALQYNE